MEFSFFSAASTSLAILSFWGSWSFCSGDGGHLAALFGTLVAGLGAFLAVLHLVLGALVSTGLADVGAQAANGFGMFASTGHCGRCQSADLGAIHVQRDASSHRLHVLLLQAGSSAVIAGRCAGVARFDAGIEFLMRHFYFLKLMDDEQGFVVDLLIQRVAHIFYLVVRLLHALMLALDNLAHVRWQRLIERLFVFIGGVILARFGGSQDRLVAAAQG